jgi:thymidine kinase/deoxyadenosine/deoxycytidine kinase
MPIDFDFALRVAVDVICAGLSNKNASSLMDKFQRFLYTLDGNIGMGKTTLLKAIAAKFGGKVLTETAPKEIMQLFYKGLAEKNATGKPNHYAGIAQMFFSGQRSQINQFGNALAGRTNDFGFPDFPWGEEAVDVFTDRSRIGDFVFVLVNWLMGDIDDVTFLALMAASKTYPTFRFDTALYIDGSAETAKARGEKRASEDPERAHEKDIPLSYYEDLRKVHYLILRECALRGAPIVCLDNTKFLNADQAVNALVEKPSIEAIIKIWAASPKLTPSSTSAEVSAAFEQVLAGYEAAPKFKPTPLENPDIPYIEIVTAGMRGGKTTEMIRRHGQHKAADEKPPLLVKPKVEDKYDSEGSGSPQLVTHDGVRRDCVSVQSLWDLKLDPNTHDVVLIDEAQFFKKELVPFVLSHPWARFIIGGLLAYSDLRPFGQIRDLVCFASKIDHYNSICQFCKNSNGAFSPALRKKTRDDEVGIHYGSACHKCWSTQNVN